MQSISLITTPTEENDHCKQLVDNLFQHSSLTQQEFGELIGLPRTTVQKIITGARETKPITLRAIQTITAWSLEYITSGSQLFALDGNYDFFDNSVESFKKNQDSETTFREAIKRWSQGENSIIGTINQTFNEKIIANINGGGTVTIGDVTFESLSEKEKFALEKLQMSNENLQTKVDLLQANIGSLKENIDAQKKIIEAKDQVIEALTGQKKA